jgi:serine/threonine protein kinase/tetratricopeptide (TPR) repeat protein
VRVLTGQIISHYRLLDRIGRHHDTEMFRARDLKLDRDVAIKILSPRAAADPASRERFRRQARFASLVSHPHICAVHDSGEEDGFAFLVCELLDGRPLDEELAEQPMSREGLLELGIQLTDALAAVHARGLIHGNIKPSNVFITSGGEARHVKLLELGVMSAWWETARPPTLDGSSPTVSVDTRVPDGADFEGFHSYRSPEQVSGAPLNHRSDIFSTGAILYEVATGTVAFPGATRSAIAAAIVSGTPAPVRRLNPRIPEEVAGIIEHALAKAPEDRYQTAAEMTADLRRARRRLETDSTPAVVPPRRASPRRAAVLAPALAGVALAGVAGWWWMRPTPSSQRHAILVGSIANGTNDPDFDGTLRQALTVHLGQSPFLDIVSDERLREILRMMGRPADAPVTHDVAREACQRLGLNAMLEGSVSAVGRSTAVAIVATDCATGEPFARQQAEVDRKEDVLREVGRMASSMRASLGESVASLDEHNVPIEEATTRSLEALKAYTTGMMKRAAGDEMDSIRYFERAIELDGDFALAYTILSSIYGGLGEAARGEEYARKAFEHRANVSERERLFITYQYHDRVTGDQLKAREWLEVWKRSYPRDYRAPNALAVLLNRVGDYEGAIVEALEASWRNPAHSFPYSNLAYAYRGAGRNADAKRVAEEAVEKGIETLPTRRLLYQLAELEGNQAEAQQHLDWARPRSRGFDLTGAQAQVQAYRGRMVGARTLYAQTVTLALRNGFGEIASGYQAQAALTEALLGNSRLAIEAAREVPSNVTYAPRARGATALAVAGAPGDAEAILRTLRALQPEDTFLHGAYLPVAEAALLIDRGRFADAIDTLRRAAPYERGTIAALLPMYFRGVARLRSGAPDEAAREFRAVLANRGADPFSPALPLAQLGLARALGRLGDREGSARAYQALLATWQHADEDLPVVKDARSESALLNAPAPAAPR